jgi:DNA polymerase (family X)
MSLANDELSRAFAEIAKLLQLEGADRFRVRAYERAADAIAAAQVDLAEVDEDTLAGLDGIGASTAEKIVQYRRTGSIDMLTELRSRVPEGLLELVRIPGLGPKTAVALYEQLGVDSVASLRAALDGQRVRTLPGLGPKSEENLRSSLDRLGAKDAGRTPTADVIEVVDALLARLARTEGVERVEPAGSLRRGRDTVGDVDVLVASDRPDVVMAAVREDPLVRRVLASGPTKTSVLTVRDLQVDVRVVPPDTWGAALLYFTGSKAHNIRVRERAVRRGLMLSEYGLFERPAEDAAEDAAGGAAPEGGTPGGTATGARVAGATEEEVYAALDLAWTPPTLREDTGEVAAAAEGRVPAVVTVEDIRGDLHGHSDWSGDGKASLETMVAAAAERGYAYWAVTDHAAGLPMNGLTRERFLARRAAIAELSSRYDIRILDGVELNIGIDGELDYDDEFLLAFDFCVASVHTLMTRGAAEQTDRIVAAMEHPAVNVIGHPTGRKIGIRPPYDVEFDRILEAATRTGTALEVNASPRRLDLSAEHVRRAVDAGVLLAISCDAHSVGDLDSLRWGVMTAQRGWATPDDVVNTRPLEGLEEFVAAKRARSGG